MKLKEKAQRRTGIKMKTGWNTFHRRKTCYGKKLRRDFARRRYSAMQT
jgi:hypothetical protein